MSADERTFEYAGQTLRASKRTIRDVIADKKLAAAARAQGAGNADEQALLDAVEELYGKDEG